MTPLNSRIRWLKRNPALKPIEAARIWLALNYDQPITIQQAAQIAGYSSSHSTRNFTEIYSQSPRDYLANLRIKKALKLLASQNIPIQQIATEVGFTSFPTFNNRFKTLTGKTPAQFQRKARAETQLTNKPVNPVIPGCLSKNLQNSEPE